MAEEQTEKRNRKLLFSALVFFNSPWIFYVYLSNTHIGTFEPAKLSKVLEGTAERPYIFRALIPVLSKILSPLTPAPLIEWFEKAPSSIKSTFDALSEGIYQREAAFILTIMFLSLIGLAYVEKKLLADLGMDRKQQFILPLFIQILILPFTISFGYLYDLPQILLIALNLLYLHRGAWISYLAVLALASLNKETSLFIIAVFTLYYWPRITRRLFIKLLASQLVLYALIRLSLIYIFRNSPGPLAFTTLQFHYNQYAVYPSTLIFTLIFLGGIGFLVARQWRQKHPFLRAASIIAVFILVLFFASGQPLEFRVFLDALPALGILLFPATAVNVKHETP